MRALVVYESMFGNTHTIANHVADGLRWRHDCDVASTAEVADELMAAADLVVVGGPTHAHGMSSAVTRKSAVDMANNDDELELDPDAESPGLRDWFVRVQHGHHRLAAAFDTRVDASPAFTGRASKGIAKRLRRHGFRLMVDPESFLVDKQNHLLDGEAERAEEWGKELAVTLVSSHAG